jgi:uncharacterized protein YdaU (DUF1376 family)
MHYYKRNLGDYAKKAGRLSMLQHGSYTLLIDACYDREQFPTLEEAYEWTWASTTDEKEAVQFVLHKFFTLEDGIYVQKRIEEEIAEYRAKAETNKRIAIDRETNRKAKPTKRAPVVNKSPPNHKPITNNQEPQGKSAIAPHLAVIPEKLLSDFLAVRKAKRAGELTETALAGIQREADKAGLTLVEAITACCEYSWVGFDADWYAKRHSKPGPTGVNKQEALEASNAAVAERFLARGGYAA